MGVVKSLFGGSDPQPPVAAPAPPVADNSNTSAAVTAQATAQTGRAADVSAGQGPSLDDSTDQYSVRKKLLGN